MIIINVFTSVNVTTYCNAMKSMSFKYNSRRRIIDSFVYVLNSTTDYLKFIPTIKTIKCLYINESCICFRHLAEFRVLEVSHNSCNIDTRALPDMYALALGR